MPRWVEDVDEPWRSVAKYVDMGKIDRFMKKQNVAASTLYFTKY